MLRAGVGRVQLMPLPRSDVCGVVCVRHDVMCIGQAAAHVLCLVAPEMSGGPSLRCQYGIYIPWECRAQQRLGGGIVRRAGRRSLTMLALSLSLYIYMYVYIYIALYIYI